MFRKHIAVDLGTANTLIFVQSRGIVLNEPSVVAVDAAGRAVAVGREAKGYIGKTPHNLHTIRPLRDGVIADFDAAQAMIAAFLKQVIGSGVRMKPDVVICVPTGITDVERRAVAEAAASAGARHVRLIEEPLAAAVGAGLPVLEPVGSMVVDMGGGTTDIAVITLGSMAGSRSLKMAGDALTAALQRFLQEKKHFVVGENRAEHIKIALGSVDPLPAPLALEVSGKDLPSANPRTLTLRDEDIRECFQPVVGNIVDALLDLLERTAPELGGDIMRQGILLTGGGALLRGLDARIARATGLPVRVDSDPLTTVLRGAGLVLEAPDRYRDLLIDC